MASTFTNLLYHIVYSTKYRRNQIDESLREELYRYLGGIIREHGGVQLEIGGMPDHVHILAKFSPSGVSRQRRKLRAACSAAERRHRVGIGKPRQGQHRVAWGGNPKRMTNPNNRRPNQHPSSPEEKEPR